MQTVNIKNFQGNDGVARTSLRAAGYTGDVANPGCYVCFLSVYPRFSSPMIPVSGDGRVRLCDGNMA